MQRIFRSFVVHSFFASLVGLGLAMGAGTAAELGSAIGSGVTSTNIVAVPKIHIPEFEQAKAKPNTIVLDVRTPAEYQEGHIAGAKLLNFQDPDFSKQVKKLDKSKTYIVHCAVGGRSSRATKEMQKLGFKNVMDFTDGFEGWKKAGKPVEK